MVATKSRGFARSRGMAGLTAGDGFGTRVGRGTRGAAPVGAVK
jgi:hypothetical protein